MNVYTGKYTNNLTVNYRTYIVCYSLKSHLIIHSQIPTKES